MITFAVGGWSPVILTSYLVVYCIPLRLVLRRWGQKGKEMLDFYNFDCDIESFLDDLKSMPDDDLAYCFMVIDEKMSYPSRYANNEMLLDLFAMHEFVCNEMSERGAGKVASRQA